MRQGNLFEDDKSIQAAFESFHAKHPEVYVTLVAYCRQMTSKGWRQAGIGLLWERIRWYYYVEKDQVEEFKVNNNYRSRYARLIMAKEADLAGFFELRTLRSE